MSINGNSNLTEIILADDVLAIASQLHEYNKNSEICKIHVYGAATTVDKKVSAAKKKIMRCGIYRALNRSKPTEPTVKRTIGTRATVSCPYPRTCPHATE